MVPAPSHPRRSSTVAVVHPPVPRTEEPELQPDLPAVLPLPQVLHDLSEIQRHVVARVAVHTWLRNGDIPFVAPNPHQHAVAMGLAAPGVRLLDVVVSPVSFQQSFRLSRLGAHVVPRLFRLISVGDDQRREREFTKMRRLMQNAWESRA